MTTRAPALQTKCWDEMISSVLTANYEVNHFSRKTIWKGTYQVSHLLTVFSSSANFYIYIAKVAKKIVFKVTNVCYMPLTFDVSECLHFQHGHPCSQSKEASETTEAVLVTNNGANSIPLPSVSVHSCAASFPAMVLWSLSQSWNIDAGVHPWFCCEDWRGKDGNDRRLGIRTRIRMWISSSALNLGLTLQILVKMKRYLELKCVSQFRFPLCYFLGPSKSLMI